MITNRTPASRSCDFVITRLISDQIAQSRTQALSSARKDPGRCWSRDVKKIDCLRGVGKVSNYMLPLSVARSECCVVVYEAANCTPFSAITIICPVLFVIYDTVPQAIKLI